MENELQNPPDHAGRLPGARACNNVETFGGTCPDDIPLRGVEWVSTIGFVDCAKIVEPGHESDGLGKVVLQLPVVVLVFVDVGSLVGDTVDKPQVETGINEIEFLL